MHLCVECFATFFLSHICELTARVIRQSPSLFFCPFGSPSRHTFTTTTTSMPTRVAASAASQRVHAAAYHQGDNIPPTPLHNGNVGVNSGGGLGALASGALKRPARVPVAAVAGNGAAGATNGGQQRQQQQEGGTRSEGAGRWR